MEKLRAYLKSLSTLQKQEFADRCRTSIGYLRKALSEKLVLREKLCAQIERESRGAVTRIDLRPEDWADIWPELAPGPQALGASTQVDLQHSG